MSNSDIFVSVAYVLYIIAPALRDELWLRCALFVNSLGFAAWGVWIESWPVVVANALFCLMSLRQIHRAYQEKRPVELSLDAARAGALVFPSMTDRDLELLWAEGEDVLADEWQLITMGEQVDQLFLLLEGEVTVDLPTGGRIVRPAPAVVGEISAVRFDSNAGATATVVATNARLRVWDIEDIAALQQERPSISAPFLRGLSAQMATRLSV